MKSLSRAAVATCALLSSFALAACTLLLTKLDGLAEPPADAATTDGQGPIAGDAATPEEGRAGGDGDGSIAPRSCPPDKGGAACDFDLVFALEIPVIPLGWREAGDVPYAVDRSGTTGAFTRVAYRLILDAEEVWVELDAFTTDPALLGVPVDEVFAQPITNVSVRSSAANQPSVEGPTTGNIEFWSHCYEAGPDNVFDGQDEITADLPDCYGSMQLSVGRSPVLALNRWALTGGADPIDVGIGPRRQGNPDWTFASNAWMFQKRRLEIYAR